MSLPYLPSFCFPVQDLTNKRQVSTARVEACREQGVFWRYGVQINTGLAAVWDLGWTAYTHMEGTVGNMKPYILWVWGWEAISAASALLLWKYHHHTRTHTCHKQGTNRAPAVDE